MADDPKTIKFQLMLSPREADLIDDWGFANRIRTRAEAMRRLCEMALRTEQIAPKVLLDNAYDLDLAVYGIIDSLDEVVGASSSKDWLELATAIDDVKLQQRKLQEVAVRTKELLAAYAAARGSDAVVEKIRVGMSDRRPPKKMPEL